MADRATSPRPSRRALLVGGGAGVGLVLAWGLWPRRYSPNLATAPGEAVLDAFLKIGTDGRVTVIVPQAEMGQGVWTALPQALADELGADWRQVAVEPAPIHPLYANTLLAEEVASEALPSFLRGIGRWAAHEYATRSALMVTAGSTSIRAFEERFRLAGANARALLCMAAAARLGIDWRACDTEAGFVRRGDDRFRFGELAAEAARFAPPRRAPLRKPGEGELSGKPLTRIDLPAKVDGSVRFAGDVRLPGMLFAAIRHGPLGNTRPVQVDKAAAMRVPGVARLIENARWVAAVANNWWAAEHALDAAKLCFATDGPLPDQGGVDRALEAALATGGKRLLSAGDPAEATGGRVEARFAVPLAAHAALEPLVATARVIGDRLEVWAPTQAPGLMRAAVAAATGWREGRITLFPMPIGGGFGRKIEVDAAVEAALIALEVKRPVQLQWSRAEEMAQGRHRPPALGRLVAHTSVDVRPTSLEVTIATPSTAAELGHRLIGHGDPAQPEAAAIEGAETPYSISARAVAHAPAPIGIDTGMWRSVARSYTCFMTESFVDELAAKSGQDPLGYRIAMLGGAPRLARCLQQAAASGGWSGEAKAPQGLAVASAFGSHVALLAEIEREGEGIRVVRLAAAVDCGRMINPDIVRQQIEGGLIWGLAAALGDRISYARGLPEQWTLDALQLPRLADIPEILVELVVSEEAPGGVAELAVPVVAPAIANAVASATGKRLRTLPLA